MGKVIEFPKNVGNEAEEPACQMSEWLYTLYSHLLDQRTQLEVIGRDDMVHDMEEAFSRLPAEVVEIMYQRYGKERGIDGTPKK
ncbi:hypothetical protein [uncultured Pseudodesulfovibrio sp.]|uniref:hypothetical protein n=1 Tax=uncultured Pseudodesulfovibrio sp. TaxID=2035858 RepID=UPI0029C66723|nr:hypothetical protein [uncultured Pseudodesulfovibrio sp.]